VRRAPRSAKQTKLDRLMLTKDGKLQPGLASSVAALAERKLNRIAWAKTNSKRLPLSGADAVAADAAYLVHHKQLTADQAKRLVDFATKAQATLRGRRYVSGTLLEAILPAVIGSSSDHVPDSRAPRSVDAQHCPCSRRWHSRDVEPQVRGRT
jgi:hypothetical protein